ncbi:MAG: UDP-N-acetylmuramate--L-alanine ligase [Thermodesulfobacteriota bacterium]|nr:UDP-N-acetylmuramate--L-alanine ligase [Thermodesulfobacteriota bacterium]
MYRKVKNIHMVGIGGIGMSGIAEVLLNLGYRVSGSDMKKTNITSRLAGLGAKIKFTHNESNGEDADVLVISTAIKDDNPEIAAAKKRKIPVIPRAEMLAELMRMKYGVAVAGAHGKTTTTSLIATILTLADLDPTVVIGGKLNVFGSTAKLGKGDLLIAEADESDGSFLKLSPTIAVVTNIDLEHLDFYKNLKRIRESFINFINKIPFYGLSIICHDDKNIRDLIPAIEKRFITYGLSNNATLKAINIRQQGIKISFNVIWNGKNLGKINMKLPGIHNIYNALASICVAVEFDIDFKIIKEGLENFSGVERRFQIKGRGKKVLFIDDYAHHPTEIKATLEAARELKKGEIHVIFQPHRYTRTKYLFNQFPNSFNHADHLILTDIYPAGEQKIPGINAEILCQAIKKKGHKNIVYIAKKEDIPDFLSEKLKPGDMVITMGAGNIYETGEQILKNLKKKDRNVS